MSQRIATVDFFDERESPIAKVLSGTQYDIMKGEIKTLLDSKGSMQEGDVEREVLVNRLYASQYGATGNDVERAFRELSGKIVDSPAEYDEAGKLLKAEVSHYDYKRGEAFYPEPVEEVVS